MLINEIFKSFEEHDTSAGDLVNVIVERNSSSAWDTNGVNRDSIIAQQKNDLRSIRSKIHLYDIEEEDRKRKVNEEREQVQTLISKMQDLQNSRSYDECMFQVYKHFRKWTSEDSFSRCDYVLKYVSTNDFDIHILISLLMASYPMRNRLSFRSVFYENVLMKARMTYSSDDIQRIFSSLR